VWLMTTKGFVSVVEWRTSDKKDKRNGMLVVRARERAHLVALVQLLEAPRPKVTESEGTDYRFRFWIAHDQFAELMAALASTVTYTNFKTAVLQDQGLTPYEQALHKVWAIMSKLQPTPPYTRKVKSKKGKAECEDCGHKGPVHLFENWMGRTLCRNVSECVRRDSKRKGRLFA
jgi:hypothetical protein